MRLNEQLPHPPDIGNESKRRIQLYEQAAFGGGWSTRNFSKNNSKSLIFQDSQSVTKADMDGHYKQHM